MLSTSILSSVITLCELFDSTAVLLAISSEVPLKKSAHLIPGMLHHLVFNVSNVPLAISPKECFSCNGFSSFSSSSKDRISASCISVDKSIAIWLTLNRVEEESKNESLEKHEKIRCFLHIPDSEAGSAMIKFEFQVNHTPLLSTAQEDSLS